MSNEPTTLYEQAAQGDLNQKPPHLETALTFLILLCMTLLGIVCFFSTIPYHNSTP